MYKVIAKKQFSLSFGVISVISNVTNLTRLGDNTAEDMLEMFQ